MTGGAFSIDDLKVFLPKTITQLYGPAASGKTNICLLAAVEEAKKGNKVVFIDTEGSFSKERITQLAGNDLKTVLSNIILAEPNDFDEQKIAINKLEELAGEGKASLIIIDSLVSLYRLEMGGGDAYALNREMGKLLAKLVKIGKKYNIPILVSNQVYSSFEKGDAESKITPVGRDLLRYWTKVIIALRKDESCRVAVLERHKFKKEGGSVSFTINNHGIHATAMKIREEE